MRIALIAAICLAGSPVFAMSKGRVQPDPITESAALSGDITGIVEGCGNQPFVGGTFCRQVEGDAAGKSIWLIGPPAKCGRDDGCVFFYVYNPQNSLVWGGALPKGTTRLELPWKLLLGRDTFELGDRGTWSFKTFVFWLDTDGKERQSVSTGDIVLRVFKTGYVPLNNVEADPNYVWNWIDNGTQYKMTAGLRAFTRKVP